MNNPFTPLREGDDDIEPTSIRMERGDAGPDDVTTGQTVDVAPTPVLDAFAAAASELLDAFSFMGLEETFDTIDWNLIGSSKPTTVRELRKAHNRFKDHFILQWVTNEVLDVGEYPYDTDVPFIAVIVDNKITSIHDLMVMSREDFKDDFGYDAPAVLCKKLQALPKN